MQTGKDVNRTLFAVQVIPLYVPIATIVIFFTRVRALFVVLFRLGHQEVSLSQNWSVSLLMLFFLSKSRQMRLDVALV